MKVTEKSLCHLITTESYCKFQVEGIYDILNKGDVDKSQLGTYEVKENFYSVRNGWRKLVLSKKTKNNLDNYIVPKKINIDVLKTLPNRADIIQIDNEQVFKYIKTDVGIVASYDVLTNLNELKSYWFRIDLRNGYVAMDSFGETEEDAHKNLINNYYSKFIVLVTYLELTDVTLDVVKPNTKRGDIFKGNFIKNESSVNVIHVNTNWNTMKIVVGEFGVRSHMRLQRVGKGLCEFKWVFINSFKKNLVIRQPQKSLQCD